MYLFFSDSAPSLKQSPVSKLNSTHTSRKEISSEGQVPQVFPSISKALISIRAKSESPEPTAVVCLNDLRTSPRYNRMKKANLKAQRIVNDSQRTMANRSVSPKTRSSVENLETRSPRKRNSESANTLNIQYDKEKSNKQLRDRSLDSSRNRSPRSKLKQSPEMKPTIPSMIGKPKELSPRELDAIRTLRQLKTPSPKKKAITNEMRKSACHNKQNERKNSTSPQKYSPDNKTNETAVPNILVTPPKGGKKSPESTVSPRRQKRSVTKNVTKSDTETIKDNIQTSPKKRGRKKKSISSSEKLEGNISNLQHSPAAVSPGESLKVESPRSTKRVRSPSARYKKDMIMYPWDSPRKKQSPKKSPSEKDVVKPGTSREFVSSGSDDSSSQDSSDNESESDMVGEKNVQAIRDSMLRAARVLNFDEVDIHEYDRIGEKPLAVDNYKSLLQTSQEKISTDLIGLSDLIAKVSGSVEKPNKDLINLFGSVEEPEYCDENVTCKSDSDGDDKVTKENSRLNKESMQVTSEETENSKPKNDSDLDSTIEYNQELAQQTEGENKLMVENLNFSGELKKEIVSSHLAEKVSNTENSEMMETQGQLDENSDDKKGRNIFDVFGDNDDSEDEKKVTANVTDDIKMESVETEVKETATKESKTMVAALHSVDTLDKELLSNTSADPENETNTDRCLNKEVFHNSDLQEAIGDQLVSETDAGYKNSGDTKLDLQNKTIDPSIDDKDSVIDEAAVLVSETKSDRVEMLSDRKGETHLNNSNVNKTDRSGYEQLRSSPRSIPRFSTVRKTITEPSPLAVLRLVEKEPPNKQCAFISHELEDYIKSVGPVRDTVTVSKLSENVSSTIQETEQLNKAVEEQMNNPEPDFDEVESFLFVSFSSEEALAAHIELEKKLDWLDETNLKRMTHFINREKCNDGDATTPSKSPQGKHSLRGVPGRISKYHKLLKQELEIIMKAKENRIPVSLRTKTPEKTADITKIKGWKKKYASTEELQRATGLHFSEAGKLHWRTEERILKQLEPSDVKEIGLNIKKKRRKLVHYTKRKGESKSDKPKPEAFDEGEEPLPLEDPENIMDNIDEMAKDTHEKIPYCVKYFSQHKYGKRKMFIKQMKMDTVDENILKKLGSQKIARDQNRKEMRETDSETRPKRTKAPSYVIKLSQSMALAALSALDKKLIAKAKSVAAQKSKKKALKDMTAHEDKKLPKKEAEVKGEKDRLSDSGSDMDGSDGYEEISEEEIKKDKLKDTKLKHQISEQKVSMTGKSGNYGISSAIIIQVFPDSPFASFYPKNLALDPQRQGSLVMHI